MGHHVVALTDTFPSFIRKSFQKILAKQGIKFKLNTKVLSADKQNGAIIVKTEAAKGGSEESVRLFQNDIFKPC